MHVSYSVKFKNVENIKIDEKSNHCFLEVKKQLESYGGEFKSFVIFWNKKEKEKKQGEKYKKIGIFFSMCSSEWGQIEREMTLRFREKVSKDKSEDTEKRFRRAMGNAKKALFFHEGHHFLSSLGDFDKDKEKFVRTLLQDGYHYYFRGRDLKANYYFDTPPMNSIFQKLEPYTFLLKKETYFNDPEKSRNDFYILLDEWNAYIEGWNLALKQEQKNCSGNSDSGNSALEFEFYAYVYLTDFSQVNPELFKKLTQDASVKRFIKSLLSRSDRLLARSKDYPCVFEQKPRQEFEPYRLQARSYLKSVFDFKAGR